MDSDDHRAAMLERAYRRGYALRRRRRLTEAGAALAAIAVVVAGVATLRSDHRGRKVSVVQPSTTTVAAQCDANVAVPAADVPSDVAAWASGRPVIGGGALWSPLLATRVGVSVNGTSYDLKFPWFTKPVGLPRIDARRLDGASSFHADANLATDARGTWVSSTLQFSAPGCWAVTARYSGSTLRFRIAVAPHPSKVVFADQQHGVGLASGCTVPPHGDPVCNFDVLETRDAGNTWTEVGGVHGYSYPGWRGYPDIELAWWDSNIWVYGTRTFESHDGGHSFQEARFDGLASALVPEGDTVWVATRACAQCPTTSMFSAPVVGGSWTKISGFPNIGDPYSQLVRPTARVAYVVGSDTHNVLYRTADAGRSWQSSALPAPPPASATNVTVSLAAIGSDQVWMLNGGGAPGGDQDKAFSRSGDGGQHWTLVADTAPARPGVGQLPKRGLTNAMAVVTPERIWLAFGSGPFIASTDGGHQWVDTGIDADITQLAFVDAQHGWAWAEAGSFGYRTTDGTHWIDSTG
jgi:hypothetical protein